MGIQHDQEGVPLVRTMMRIGIPLVIMSIVLFVTGLILWNTALHNGDENDIIRQWVVSYYLMYGSVIIGVAGLILVVLNWVIPIPEDESTHEHFSSSEGPTFDLPSATLDQELDKTDDGPPSTSPTPDIAADMPVEEAIIFCETCHQPNVPGSTDCTKCGRPL